MNLTDTWYLRRTEDYTNPANDNDILPYVYGDTSLGSTFGTWTCPCIDTINSVYAIAGHPLPVLPGELWTNAFPVGILWDYQIVYSGNYEGLGEIAYVQFEKENISADENITCNFKGKEIDNPIDIIEDILIEAGYTGRINQHSFNKARRLAEGFQAGGLIAGDQPLTYWLNQILGSFLGSFWLDNNGKLTINLDLLSNDPVYPISTFLKESHLTNAKITRTEENLCNQTINAYAAHFRHTDRRTRTQTKLHSFDQIDNGEATKDIKSIRSYQLHLHEFELFWIRDATTVQAISARLISLYKDPLQLLSVTEQSIRNFAIERGDYVVLSCKILRDEYLRPLKNQIWKVLEIEKNTEDYTITYLLQDTGKFYHIPPIYYDGVYTIGTYDGRTREQRLL